MTPNSNLNFTEALYALKINIVLYIFFLTLWISPTSVLYAADVDSGFAVFPSNAQKFGVSVSISDGGGCEKSHRVKVGLNEFHRTWKIGETAEIIIWQNTVRIFSTKSVVFKETDLNNPTSFSHNVSFCVAQDFLSGTVILVSYGKYDYLVIDLKYWNGVDEPNYD